MNNITNICLKLKSYLKKILIFVILNIDYLFLVFESEHDRNQLL